jgi:hypothetical protein
MDAAPAGLSPYANPGNRWGMIERDRFATGLQSAQRFSVACVFPLRTALRVIVLQAVGLRFDPCRAHSCDVSRQWHSPEPSRVRGSWGPSDRTVAIMVAFWSSRCGYRGARCGRRGRLLLRRRGDRWGSDVVTLRGLTRRLSWLRGDVEPHQGTSCAAPPMPETRGLPTRPARRDREPAWPDRGVPRRRAPCSSPVP